MKPLLCTVFINPQTALALSLTQWDIVIRQARRAHVLARLRQLLQSAGLLAQIPPQPLLHLESAHIYYERFQGSLQREIRHVQEALKPLEIPVILLKGSAYSVAGNNAALGRTFSDIDILVTETALPDVEMALINAGWITSTLDPYDQKYYRQWMHEIPPMRHLSRQTSIDVHHNILPKTVRSCPDAQQLWANRVPVPEQNLWLLSPEDRVLHSAAHLFHEGEWAMGFRDLSDLDLLLKEFSATEGFWANLLQRAETLKLQIPLFYALRYTHQILQTPIPEAIIKSSGQHLSNKIHTLLMDALFLRVLIPAHDSCNDRWTGVARWLLFVRSHWLRMPLYLVIPHLLRKSLLRLTGKAVH
ncbi:MAG: nucleotidyltransferase family protein [Methylococcaceae bacterium]|nr:nucleotidyltransferase family protein [Methylococcaceae bacterium]